MLVRLVEESKNVFNIKDSVEEQVDQDGICNEMILKCGLSQGKAINCFPQPLLGQKRPVNELVPRISPGSTPSRVRRKHVKLLKM